MSTSKNNATPRIGAPVAEALEAVNEMWDKPGTTLEWTGHGQAKFLISIPLRK